MTSQKPPRPSKPPSRKETVEVQLEWLEEAGTKLKAKSKLPPPPLPNARVQAPPMPVTPSNPPPARSTKPPPRNPPTLEVDMRELIIVPTMPVPPLLKSTRPTGNPIPREEEDAPRPPRRTKPPPARRTKPPPR